MVKSFLDENFFSQKLGNRSINIWELSYNAIQFQLILSNFIGFLQ